MNAKLLQLIQEAVDDPGNISLMDDIWALRPSESDFDDELFDAFAPSERGVIYIGMDMWCAAGPTQAFLNRRLTIEKDSLCRSLLKSRLARHAREEEQANRSCQRSVHHRKRTPEFQRILKDLVLEHVMHPNNLNASRKITSLEPTEEDLGDELLDSLTPEERLEVYSMLLLWCGYSYQRRILERRALVETDSACKLAISVMLGSSR